MIELIPAIDIIDGKCVRLEQGSYDQQKVYSSQPEEVAIQLADLGILRLHLVDLDGARAGHLVNLDILEKISSQTSLKIDFGGGIKSDDDISQVMKAGAEMVTAGSIAVRDRDQVEEWLNVYGPERIILGADVRNGKISIHGWQEDTTLELMYFVRTYADAGIKKLICTDISRDGMLQGPSLGLYKELRAEFPELEIIASGGVSEMQDIRDLDEIGINGVIFGKAFYEGRITEEEISTYMKSS
ncbi:1-(5-phosphoribosyl)-5-[(5-phosphoribosylamino)methylideneamino]imidazole-4-carboxamide isomerase [Bacteroidota bacterium]